jgi:hypothetical protein
MSESAFTIVAVVLMLALVYLIFGIAAAIEPLT